MDAAKLYFVARKLKAVAEASLKSRTLPIAQAIVLLEVREQPGISIGEIARRHGMAQSLVSTAVMALQKGELLLADPDPKDRRRTALRLPASEPNDGVTTGETKAQENGALKRVLSVLDPDEQKVASLGLSLLYRALKSDVEALERKT